MKIIYLYSTAGCHLCEIAKEIVWDLLDHYSLLLEEIDIAESDTLMKRYGVSIPVLVSSDMRAELKWPFDRVQAQQFLAQLI